MKAVVFHHGDCPAIGGDHARRKAIAFFEDTSGAWRLVDGLAVNANGLFTSGPGER